MDFDIFDNPTTSFSESFGFGELPITDENLNEVTFFIDTTPIGGFGTDPGSRFFIEESTDFGGFMLMTDYVFD